MLLTPMADGTNASAEITVAAAPCPGYPWDPIPDTITSVLQGPLLSTLTRT